MNRNQPFGLRFYRSSVKKTVVEGVLIYRHGRIRNDRADFDLIFRCLYPLWADRFLLKDYRVFDEAEGVRLRLEHGQSLVWANGKSSLLVFSASVLESLGPRMEEGEGNLLLIYDSPPPETMTFADSWNFSPRRKPNRKHPRNRWREGLHCVIHNWDGIYWELFTVDEQECVRLLDEHRDNRALTPYWVDFDKDFPDPRNHVELERA